MDVVQFLSLSLLIPSMPLDTTAAWRVGHCLAAILELLFCGG